MIGNVCRSILTTLIIKSETQTLMFNVVLMYGHLNLRHYAWQSDNAKTYLNPGCYIHEDTRKLRVTKITLSVCVTGKKM